MKTFFLLVGILPWVAMTAGCDGSSVGGEPKVVGKQQRSTRLYVRTVPPGAKITIDGHASGTSDRLLTFEAPADAKKVVIEVELDGRRDHKEIVIRGGEIKRVEFDLSRSAVAANAEKNSVSEQVGDRLDRLDFAYRKLVDLPRGWRAIRPIHLVPREATDEIEKRLGGKIEDLFNSEFQTPHGVVGVNLIHGRTIADAQIIHLGVLDRKGDPAYCLRFDRVVVEFVGEFDVAAAKRIAEDLGLDAARASPPAAIVSSGAPLGVVGKMQPVVVRTLPRSGDTQVDPATSEILVTFSKDMRDGNWSWSQISDESFPETTGSPHYLDDERTCVLPVKLRPGKVYVIWLNSQRFTNFKDTEGRAAVPYLLVFETKKE